MDFLGFLNDPIKNRIRDFIHENAKGVRNSDGSNTD
jgi:hypothetical protein